jgi:hypothetical protein
MPQRHRDAYPAKFKRPTTLASCVPFLPFESQHGSPPSPQNIALGFSTRQGAESAFMIEIGNCPPSGVWSSCTYTKTTAHYINIMSANY